MIFRKHPSIGMNPLRPAKNNCRLRTSGRAADWLPISGLCGASKVRRGEERSKGRSPIRLLSR